MLKDMQVRNLSSNTQRAYIENVARIAHHFGRSPTDLGPQKIRAFQLHFDMSGNSHPGSRGPSTN